MLMVCYEYYTMHIKFFKTILFFSDRVSSAKRLRGGVRFIDEIPKNVSGKILRRELRALLAQPKSKL